MKSHSAKASPNGRAIETSYGRLQTVADGCELENNVGQTQLYPQTPKLNENPSLRIRENILQAETKDSSQIFLGGVWFCFGFGSKFDLLLSPQLFFQAHSFSLVLAVYGRKHIDKR